MAQINFLELTPSNGAVQDLNALLFQKVLGADRLAQVFNVFFGVTNGDKVGLIGEFGLVGKEAQGCSPKYSNTSLDAEEKTWELGRWGVYEKICYADLLGTLAQVAMKRGVNIADLTGTDYLDDVVYPRMELAIYKMFMRFAWFGDTSADTVSGGGVLTNGTDAGYFTVTDGFWKRAYEVVAEDATRRVTIAANIQATYADQRSAILADGVATGIIDELIFSASPDLRQAANQVIFVTQSLKDALDRDIRKNNVGSDLEWRSLFDGIVETNYNGIRLIAVPFWDSIIQTYENTGTAWNKPHRAFYSTTGNLLVGVDNYTDFAELNVHFDEFNELNLLKSKGALGTIIAQDNMIQVAY